MEDTLWTMIMIIAVNFHHPLQQGAKAFGGLSWLPDFYLSRLGRSCLIARKPPAATVFVKVWKIMQFVPWIVRLPIAGTGFVRLCPVK